MSPMSGSFSPQSSEHHLASHGIVSKMTFNVLIGTLNPSVTITIAAYCYIQVGSEFG